MSLENEKVRSNAEDYVKALRNIVNGKDDVVGFVFAINGEINSGDTYGSNELFEKLWPRLLKAAGIEAVAETFDSKRAGEVSAEDIRDFLRDAESGRITSTPEVTDRVSMTKRETGRIMFSESRDSDRSGWLHRSYIAR